MTKATHFTRGNDQNRHDRVVVPPSQEAMIKTSGTVQYNDQSHPLHKQQQPKQAWPCGIMTTGTHFTSSNGQNSRDQTEVTIAPTWKSVLHKLLSHFQGNNPSNPFNQPIEHDTAPRPFFVVVVVVFYLIIIIFMAPHLVTARSAYKGIRMRLFHHTHSHGRAHVNVN